MRRGFLSCGVRIASAAASVPTQQEAGAARAMAAAAAGHTCCLHQALCHHHRASSSAATSSAFTAVLCSSRGRRSKHQQAQSWAAKPAFFPKLVFNISRECRDSFSRDFSDRSFVLKFNKREDGEAGPPSTSAGENRFSSYSQLEYAAAMLPHPMKVARGGEDAFFMEGSWLGVSDGVGGWASLGVDSGAYSRELMSHCKALVAGEDAAAELKPKEVLVKAASSTKARGSATALIAALSEKILHVANLGDAGFIVVRDWAVVAGSKPMQHQFNFPYQVGTDGDDPKGAETYEVSVCKGDIIVLGTDGLFDNLFEHDIVEILKQSFGQGCSVQVAATQLVERAQVIGSSTSARTPFENAAWSSDLEFQGGKLDDVTAVVAFVT